MYAFRLIFVLSVLLLQRINKWWWWWWCNAVGLITYRMHASFYCSQGQKKQLSQSGFYADCRKTRSLWQTGKVDYRNGGSKL